MSTYKFNKFFRSEDIEHENDLKVQEDLLKTVNNLIDEGILVMEDGKPIKHLICNGTNIFNDLIDPDTLCQYTGLTDKNGKKIWENDILRYSYDYDGSPFLKDGEEIKYRAGAVFWSEWRGSWAVCGRGNKKCTNNDVFKYNRNPNRTEVNGNIFDNPELLEVE